MPGNSWTKAPSRQGKKQVIAFLKPNQAEAAYDKAARDGLTNQEIIGQAINAVFASKGMASPITMGHRRIVRRGLTRASIRSDARVPSCRSGRVSYGGWFEKTIVDSVQAFASEFEMSLQTLIEEGIYYVTGVKTEPEPTEAEPYILKLPDDEISDNASEGIEQRDQELV